MDFFETHIASSWSGAASRAGRSRKRLRSQWQGRIAQWLVLAITSSPAFSAPLPKSQVSADAKWIVHLDMEQFAPSQTCRLLMAGKNDAKSFQALLDRYRTLLGVDPLKDLCGITLYGNETTGSRGVALFNGSLNHRAITRQFSSYPQYRTKTAGKLALHTWLDKNTGRPLWAAFQTTRELVLTTDEPSLLAATATITGSRPSLTTWKTQPFPLPATQDGTFFIAATKGYAGSNSDPVKALILRNTDTATLQLAESRGIVDGAIRLNASSPDAAMQIHQILNGLIVGASLADSASPVAKLAEMSAVSRNDKLVMLKLHCPATDAASILAGALLTP